MSGASATSPAAVASMFRRQDRAMLAAIERHATEQGICLAHVDDLAWFAVLTPDEARATITKLIADGVIVMRPSPMGDRDWIILARPAPRTTDSLSPPARRPAASVREAVGGGALMEGAPA